VWSGHLFSSVPAGASFGPEFKAQGSDNASCDEPFIGGAPSPVSGILALSA